MRRLVALAASLILASSVAAGATADDIARAKQALEAGRAEEAYGILDALGTDASDPELDYLLGIAALDSGRPGIALFALERALMANPKHVFARAELGRALLRLGEQADAEREFDAVLADNPPPEVRERIERFRHDRSARVSQGMRLTGFVELVAGYDSNYASATSDRQVGLPVFGNLLFTLDDLFVKDGAGVMGARAGARLVKALDQRTLLIADVDGGGHGYPGAATDFFDATIRGNIGVLRRLGQADSVAVTMNGFNTWVLGLDYLRSLGLTGAWTHALDPQNDLQTFVRYANLGFDPLIDYRDANQYLAGTGVVHHFGREAVLGLHVYGGVEEEDTEHRADVGRDIYGVKLAGSWAFAPRWTLEGAVSGQFSRYHGEDGLFLRTRSDDRVTVELALDYTIAPRWTVGPQFTFVKDDSNIPTSAFERYAGLITVRHSFE